MGEITSAATFLLTALSQTMASTLSFNQLRAVNAGRCAVVNLGENTWTFLMAGYLVVKQFAPAETIAQLKTEYVDEYYPWVCTCSTEAEMFSFLLGGDAESAAIMSSCSEIAQKQALKNTNTQYTNTQFKASFNNTAAGKWSNSTNPDTSNITLTQAETLQFTQDTMAKMGWNATKMNLTLWQENYNTADNAATLMPATSLKAFMDIVLANQ